MLDLAAFARLGADAPRALLDELAARIGEWIDTRHRGGSLELLLEQPAPGTVDRRRRRVELLVALGEELAPGQSRSAQAKVIAAAAPAHAELATLGRWPLKSWRRVYDLLAAAERLQF